MTNCQTATVMAQQDAKGRLSEAAQRKKSAGVGKSRKAGARGAAQDVVTRGPCR